MYLFLRHLREQAQCLNRGQGFLCGAAWHILLRQKRLQYFFRVTLDTKAEYPIIIQIEAPVLMPVFIIYFGKNIIVMQFHIFAKYGFVVIRYDGKYCFLFCAYAIMSRIGFPVVGILSNSSYDRSYSFIKRAILFHKIHPL